MARWNVAAQLGEVRYDGTVHPVISALLRLRRIEGELAIREFLSPEYDGGYHDPFAFVQMEKAIKRIDLARSNKQLVAVFGDYDADGVTSSVIVREMLKDLGIDCIVYIPDKKSEGYGMNQLAVQELASKGVKLIITVDCGITGIKEVEMAASLGVDVIITDHHHVQERVPDALAIINPHQKGCGYPFADLAGVGVAFKLVQAAYKALLPEKEEMAKWMLDLVAIGTIADCVPLVGENRIFTKYGLIVLSKTRRVGLHELFHVGRIAIDERQKADAWKIAFQIAPRINAAGRIEHANLAYDLLKEEDRVKARDFALELEASNSTRQKMTEQIAGEVRKVAQNMFKQRKFIYAVGEHFFIGVVGLVAGRIAQEFNRPTAIFQKGEMESTGSLRSIPQVNIIKILEKCGELLVKFGGHSQAAGVTVRNDRMEEFLERMESFIAQELDGEDLEIQLNVDLEISPSHVDFELVDSLAALEPFGEGNRQPLFLMKNLLVDEVRPIGNGQKHLKMMLRAQDGTPKIFEAIRFNAGEKMFALERGDTVDAVFSLRADEWNGNRKIQLSLEDLKKPEEPKQ